MNETIFFKKKPNVLYIYAKKKPNCPWQLHLFTMWRAGKWVDGITS